MAAHTFPLCGACIPFFRPRALRPPTLPCRSSPGGPWLHEVLAGSSLVLPSPPARPKSPALQRRLRRLQVASDAAVYTALVSDVTAAERKAANQERFGTYRQQLGFGACGSAAPHAVA